MGIFDKAKDLINQHNDKVDQGIDKAAGLIDERTGSKHSEQISQATQRAKDALDDAGGHPRDTAVPPGAHPDPLADQGPVASPDPGVVDEPGSPRG